MPILGTVLAITVAVIALWQIARIVWGDRLSLSRSKLPCATCQHCRKLFDDGAMCSWNNRVTFMKESHIANCHSWTARDRA